MRRRTRLLLLPALLALAVAGVSQAAPSKTYAVRAVDFKFTGMPKTAPVGSHTFRLVNNGRASHDLRIAGKKTKLLGSGERATLTVRLKRGRYAYICTVPGHAALGMKGTLVVK